MIGVQAVATLLPNWAVVLFVFMLLAGLSSTFDSGLSAMSSLWVTDIMSKGSERTRLRNARLAMIGVSLVGYGLALLVWFIPNFGLFHLFWIINAAAATAVVPTVLSLYWDKLSARGVTWGVGSAFVIGLPLFIYSNIVGESRYVVGSSILIILISTLFCIALPRKESPEDTISALV